MESKSQPMPRKRNEESGKYTQAYRSEEFLEAVQESDGPASTTEVADRLGCSKRTALSRLRELAEDGHLSQRKVGTVNLWSVAESEAISE
jgi:Mn-dependent DtxR family transcriptional regulator